MARKLRIGICTARSMLEKIASDLLPRVAGEKPRPTSQGVTVNVELAPPARPRGLRLWPTCA